MLFSFHGFILYSKWRLYKQIKRVGDGLSSTIIYYQGDLGSEPKFERLVYLCDSNTRYFITCIHVSSEFPCSRSLSSRSGIWHGDATYQRSAAGFLSWCSCTLYLGLLMGNPTNTFGRYNCHMVWKISLYWVKGRWSTFNLDLSKAPWIQCHVNGLITMPGARKQIGAWAYDLKQVLFFMAWAI